MTDHLTIDDAIIVPEGKLWFIQSNGQSNGHHKVIINGNSYTFFPGGIYPEGTKIICGSYTTSQAINIIEYDLNAQTISLNTNDTKLDNKIQLFPNPTNSRLSLNSDKDYNIEVFDLNGRKIMEVQGNNLDMSNLSKATYIVKAFDKASKETYSYKVIRN
jgi:hypothetical protein